MKASTLTMVHEPCPVATPENQSHSSGRIERSVLSGSARGVPTFEDSEVDGWECDQPVARSLSLAQPGQDGTESAALAAELTAQRSMSVCEISPTASRLIPVPQVLGRIFEPYPWIPQRRAFHPEARLHAACGKHRNRPPPTCSCQFATPTFTLNNS